METLIVESGPSYEPVPAGFYTCEFVGVEDTTITKAGEEPKETTRWTFKVTQDGPYKGRTIDGLADKPPRLSNKMGKWVAGLAGKPLAAGLEVKPATCVGKPYMVVLEPNRAGRVAINTFSPLPV